MKQNENEGKRSFEDALFFTLKKHGLLFPVKIEEADDLNNVLNSEEPQLPKGLDDAERFLPKRGKTVSFVPKRDVTLRKVASKAGLKRKKKK